MATVTFRVEDEVAAMARARALELGVSLSDVLRGELIAWLQRSAQREPEGKIEELRDVIARRMEAPARAMQIDWSNRAMKGRARELIDPEIRANDLPLPEGGRGVVEPDVRVELQRQALAGAEDQRVDVDGLVPEAAEVLARAIARGRLSEDQRGDAVRMACALKVANAVIGAQERTVQATMSEAIGYVERGGIEVLRRLAEEAGDLPLGRRCRLIISAWEVIE